MWKHSHDLPRQKKKKKAGRDRLGGGGYEWETKLCVSVCVCVFVLREREKPFSMQVSSYCSQNKSVIRANDAPQKALSCFPLFSCQHDSFLSTHPLPPRLSHFSVQLSPLLSPAIQLTLCKKTKKQMEHRNSPKFLRMDGFFQRTTRVFSFVPLLPSVLCWLPYLLGGT